jgi:hypothetical protein
MRAPDTGKKFQEAGVMYELASTHVRGGHGCVWQKGKGESDL